MILSKEWDIYLPREDIIGVNDIRKGIDYLNGAIFLCEQKRTAIQAGGHVGLYPIELSKHFQTIHTFEPIKENFDCIEKNINKSKKYPGLVIKYNKGLSDKNESLYFENEYKETNTGTWHVVNTGDNKIEAITIDSLNLSNVDLIQLDIEGHELKALRGAEKTIKKDSPVIMIEDRGYGVSCFDYLESLGYELECNFLTDKVFIRKEKD